MAEERDVDTLEIKIDITELNKYIIMSSRGIIQNINLQVMHLASRKLLASIFASYSCTFLIDTGNGSTLLITV
jgi:hypothetical protein